MRPVPKCFRANREQLEWCQGLSSECQGQNLALTGIYVPYSLCRSRPGLVSVLVKRTSFHPGTQHCPAQFTRAGFSRPRRAHVKTHNFLDHSFLGLQVINGRRFPAGSETCRFSRSGRSCREAWRSPPDPTPANGTASSEKPFQSSPCAILIECV